MSILLMAGLLAGVNLVTLLQFWIDKSRAAKGLSRNRIPEKDLLFWACIGGTPAAYAARAMLRHKIRKQPFSARLHTIAIIQAFALVIAGSWTLGS